MRLFTALALTLMLLFASQACAALGDDLDFENQTQGYGKFLGYVCAAGAAIGIVLVVTHVIKGMIAEGKRGKKSSFMPEVVLDDIPQKKEILYVGEKVPDWKVAPREEATTAALKFLSRTDKWLNRQDLAGTAEDAFRTVKAGLEERSSKRIARLATPECLAELQDEIKKLKKKGELHIFGKLEVTDVQIIHFEAPASKTKHTFTAMISAKSKDYIKDDESGEVLRGDKKAVIYQEFWCFRRTKERWLLERIRTSTDMDRVLNPKNVMTQADYDKFAKDADPVHLREFVPS